MMMESLTDGLPVPYDALLELGVTPEEIAEALDSQPLVVAAQAKDAPGAYFDVASARSVASDSPHSTYETPPLREGGRGPC